MSKTPSKISYFNENFQILLLYAMYWGVDDQFDVLHQTIKTGSDSDIAYAARKMQLELPDIRQAKMSGYYMLEKLGK